MTPDQISQLIDQKIIEAAKKAQYNTAPVAKHYHNQVDSPNLPQHSVTGFAALDGLAGGVANPDVLNGQTLVQGNSIVTIPATTYNNIYTYPLPIIYGYGTTCTATLFSASVTMTGTPIAGATSATLTGNWTDATGHYWTQFASGETKFVLFTHNSTAVSWAPGLTSGAGGAGLTVGIPGIGAVSATLSGNWGGASGTFSTQFTSGEIRNITYTSGSAAITWSIPLETYAFDVNLVILNNARFHGGTAPYGTALIFRNDDDNVLQLWVRTSIESVLPYTWASITMTLSIFD